MSRSQEIALNESEKIALIGIQDETNEAKPVLIQEHQTEIEIEEDTKNQPEDEDQLQTTQMNESINVLHAELLVTGYLRSFVRDLPAGVDEICKSIANYYWIAKIQPLPIEEDTKIHWEIVPENIKKEHQMQVEVPVEQLQQLQLDVVMNNLYYIYYEHTITGPFEPKDILKLYITSKIKDEIWVQRDDSGWVSIKLKAESVDSDNETLQETFPELHDYLIPKLKLVGLNYRKAPLNVPDDAVKKLSTGRRVIKWIGYVLLVVSTLIVGAHILPLACFFGGCVYFPMSRCFKSIKRIGLIIAPFVVVYLVLLAEVDADYWDDEIQSWMIGYIAWGILSCLLISVVPLWILLERFYQVVSYESGWWLERFFAAEFWILGVSFGSISTKDLMEITDFDELGVMFFLIFPACAAVLPSFIIGFIANFAFEEKFELQCSDDYIDSGSNLCYNDGSGCCEVISSHDISNTYTFVGGLASNILATWAIIRICGYLLVAASDEASVFAERNK